MDDAECYVTSEVDSSDRMLVDVTEHEFGFLSEGDCGMLAVQGDRFCDFERKANK